MNWRRGFYRFWLAGAILNLPIALWVGYASVGDGRTSADIETKAKEMEAEFWQYTNDITMLQPVFRDVSQLSDFQRELVLRMEQQGVEKPMEYVKEKCPGQRFGDDISKLAGCRDDALKILFDFDSIEREKQSAIDGLALERASIFAKPILLWAAFWLFLLLLGKVLVWILKGFRSDSE